jgi:guanylate kinase
VTPFLLVLSSPSGAGKTSIARRLLETRPDLAYSVSATTRPKRPAETDGRDYHFLASEEFERRVSAGAFLEHASYGGNRYGTLRGEVAAIFQRGKHALLDIEVAGARQLRATFEDAVHVFVLPPSGDELVRRLEGRNTEDPAAVRRRLDHAAEELAAVGEYGYAVVNDDLARAVNQISAIVDAEGQRIGRQAELTDFVAALRRQVLAEAARFPVS